MDTPSPRSSSPPPRSHRKAAIAGAVVALLAVAAGTWLWLSPKQAVPSAAAAPVAETHPPVSASMLRVATVHAEPLPLSEPLPAHLTYDEDHTTRVLPAWSGRLSKVDVSIGDAVRAGQRLAEVDSPDFGGARADLAKAEADLALKRKALERSHALLDAQVIARKDAEQAEADAAQAESEAERARLRLANLLPSGQPTHGEHIPLTAPIAGWVTERTATPGQELGNGSAAPLFVVSDLHRLWLTIDLPEHLLAHVKPGAEVRVKVDAWPDEVFKATVDRVGLVIDPATRRVPVRAWIANPDLRLKPEMYAQVAMPRPDGMQAVAVPNGALVSQGYDTVVLVQRAGGDYERRTVRVGLRAGSVSYLTEGLRDGDVVVVQGALLLGAQLSEDHEGRPDEKARKP